MGVSGIFGKRNLHKIEVSVESPAEVFAGVEFLMKITLTNKRGFLPGFLLKVSAAGAETIFPFIDPKTSQYKYIPFTFPARGAHPVSDIYVCSVFPFNFFMRCTPVSDSGEFVVFPEPKKCSLTGTNEWDTKSGGEKPSGNSGFDSDIVSIRNYIHGDPLKYISWKATARSGKLKTKELSSLAFDPVLIDFDKTGIADREQRISCVTYTILALSKRNIPVGLKLNDTVFRPDTSRARRSALLNALAVLPADG